jgi:hypothetical protein
MVKAVTTAMRFEMKKVSVSKPIVTGTPSKRKRTVGWNPPELEGMTAGQIHEYYERLGCEAAERAESQLKDAHAAWLHGWTMSMEHADKLEHLKKGIGDRRDKRR